MDYRLKTYRITAKQWLGLVPPAPLTHWRVKRVGLIGPRMGQIKTATGWKYVRRGRYVALDKGNYRVIPAQEINNEFRKMTTIPNLPKVDRDTVVKAFLRREVPGKMRKVKFYGVDITLLGREDLHRCIVHFMRIQGDLDGTE